jgi:hypothetical protein
MAYAFSKLDDYFRRNKTGTTGGNLQRGTSGAPPPTVQAQNLAKSAETSTEQGNAGAASAYRAAKGSDTSAIQSRLSKPAEEQAANWSDMAERGAGEYRAEADKTIGQTYQAFDPKDIAGAEAGTAGAAGKLSSQVGYTGKEATFQPFQVEAPKLDTSSMLSSGVGGIQGSLQQKGGRYTPGMAALDASVMAGNKQAMAGLQNKLGGIVQGAREKKTALEGTDEAMAAKAQTRADEIKAATKTALQSRLGALREAQQGQFNEQMGTPQTREAQRQALLSQFPGQLDYWANFSGITPEQLASKGLGITPESLIQSRMENVNVGPSTGQTNLASILGIAPAANISGQRQVWSMQDPGALYRQNVGLYQQKVEQEAAAARAAQLRAQQQAEAEAQRQAQLEQQQNYSGGQGDAGGYDGGDYSSSSDGESYSGDTSGGGYTDFGPDYDYDAAYGDTY